MCESIANGGRRCAHHTYPAYSNALDYCKLGRVITPPMLENLLQAATKYASTPKGNLQILEDIEVYRDVPIRGVDISGILACAHEKGLANINAYNEREAEISELIDLATKPPSQIRLTNALSVLDDEINRGLDIPAPVGSFVCEAMMQELSQNYENSEIEDRSLGLYQSEEEAEKVLAQTILAILSGPNGRNKVYGKPGWETKESWIPYLANMRESMSDKEIIAWYEKNGSNQQASWVTRREVNTVLGIR